MASKEELLAKLSECVVEMEDEEAVDVAKEYIEAVKVAKELTGIA